MAVRGKAKAKRKTPTTRAAPLRRLPRAAKGKRAQFFDDPAVDQLFAIVTALTGEISVLSERLASVERLLVAAGTLPDGAVEAFEPEGQEAQRRTEARESLIERVFQVLETNISR